MQRVHIRGFEMHSQLSYFQYTKEKCGIAIYEKKICSAA